MQMHVSIAIINDKILGGACITSPNYLVGSSMPEWNKNGTFISFQCMCGGYGSIVNCGFLNLSSLPNSFPSNMQELYLFNNNLGELQNGLELATKLKILDLRRSAISGINPTFFTNPINLLELNLQNNVITKSGVTTPNFFNLYNGFSVSPFRTLLNLNVLNLASNLISVLTADIFKGLNSLQILHLEGNQLTGLVFNIFYGLVNLQELYLQNNFFTKLVPSLFRDQSLLRILNIQNHVNLRIIPPNLFLSTTQLSSIDMRGSASSCSVSTSSAVVCACAAGFVGLVTNNFCEPIDCGPVIPQLPLNSAGTLDATSSCNVTQFSLTNTTCIANCNTGLFGGPAAFICSTTGKWVGSLTCSPLSCPSVIPNLDPNAGILDINGVYFTTSCPDSHFRGSPCVAKCKPGYVSGITGGFKNISGVSQFTCSSLQNWIGNITCIGKLFLFLYKHVSYTHTHTY